MAANTGGAAPIIGETPSGAQDSANKTFTLANTPTADADVAFYLNGQRLKLVGATPGNTEYTISGATITTGYAPASDDHIVADYKTAGTRLVFEDLTATGTSFTLANTPSSDDDVALFLNGQRIKKDATPTVTEYSITGASITTGHTLTASDTLEAIYLVS